MVQFFLKKWYKIYYFALLVIKVKRIMKILKLILTTTLPLVTGMISSPFDDELFYEDEDEDEDELDASDQGGAAKTKRRRKHKRR